MKKFLDNFTTKKPIFAMLHLKGDSNDEIMERAIKEIAIYESCGVDAMIVENYYGTYAHMVMVLDYIKEYKPNIRFGINCLNNDAMNFELAIKYHALFVQLDSVAGHVTPHDDVTFEAFMKLYRERYDGFVLGGVRFKYQPYLSGRSLEKDLLIGMQRCDAIVVTQDATGQETSMEKINAFRSTLKDFPLVIGAGLTPSNCKEQFQVGDAAIVGSYFKDTHQDTGDVCETHVKEILTARDAV